MSENYSKQETSLLKAWQEKIEVANRNNIFCHCRACNYEWVDSSTQEICPICRNSNIEKISCWQFPDD